MTDNPYPFWTFYSLFILGGLTALSLSLSEAPNTTIAVFGSIIGLGNSVGGVYMMSSTIWNDSNQDTPSKPLQLAAAEEA